MLLPYRFVQGLENVYPNAFKIYKAYCDAYGYHYYDDFDTTIFYVKFKKEFVKLGYSIFNKDLKEEIIMLFDLIEKNLNKFYYLMDKWRNV